MERTVHLTLDQVPLHLRTGYQGRKLKAIVTLQVTIPSDAGVFCGGTRETYRAVVLADGTDHTLSSNAAPWDPRRKEQVLPLKPGVTVVRHSVFQGKDHGLTFYVHPDDAVKLLPAPLDLSANERVVLGLTGLRADLRSAEAARKGIGHAELLRITTRLQELKLLNKVGAITTAGRNARGEH